MGSTHLSMPVTKRKKILAMNEVHLVDSQQNEGLKCFFLETISSISYIPMKTTHFSCVLQKEIRFLPRTKFFPSRWNSTKRRIEMIFSKNQSIHFVYPNENYLFLMPITKRKYILTTNEVRPIDSRQNEGLKCFFLETKASISCILIRTTLLSCVSWKETRFFPQMKFIPLNSNKKMVEMLFCRD